MAFRQQKRTDKESRALTEWGSASKGGQEPQLRTRPAVRPIRKAIDRLKKGVRIRHQKLLRIRVSRKSRRVESWISTQ